MVVAERTEAELLNDAIALWGQTLGEIAARLHVRVPASTVHSKGFAGQLIERALGATNASRPEPDFPHIGAHGVELKTIPLRADCHPLESTFVCTASLIDLEHTDWEQSVVWAKLRCVLWVPIEAEVTTLEDRRIGKPLLWKPTDEQTELLKRDWELLASLIADGKASTITGHVGDVLQVRPKAAHGRVRRSGPSTDGSVEWTLPRGFYLRSTFTGRLFTAQ